MRNISSRRYLIAVALLVAAVAGALLRSFSSPQSTSYYLGTLLMVMWIPIVGNIIAFAVRKVGPTAPAESPILSTTFVSQMVVELDLDAERSLQLLKRERDGKIHGLFVLGTEGFSVRISPIEDQAASGGKDAEVQFLASETALPKFSAGTTFKLAQGRSFVGTGRVLSLSQNA